jgi:hypothetical protein
MPNPPSQRTKGSTLSDIFLGVVFSFMVTPLSIAIGAGCGILLADFGMAIATLSGIVITSSIALICAAGLGFGVGGFASTSPRALALGLGGIPMLGAVPLLLPAIATQSLILAAAPLALGMTQALGGYIGCRLAQPRRKPQLGIGHTCSACNYDLSATADHQPCPECGHTYRLAPPDSATSTNQPPYSPPN